MRLVSTINPKLSLGILLLLGSFIVSAQENSPFSRYGLGNIVPAQHVASRGMAGITATYRDAQSINFSNPASYSALKVVTFDVGVGIENRKLRSANPVNKYSSTNFAPAYIALGFPIDTARKIGLVFGLRPITRINYSIVGGSNLPNVDRINSLYEGNGGLNQLFIGLGKRWGGLSLGANTGASFGRKETTTRLFLSDTSSNVPFANSNTGTTTTFSKLFLGLGFQYEAKLNSTSALRFGFNANLAQKLNAKEDKVRETFVYDNSGGTFRIDSVFETKEIAGKIEIPATYTAGISFHKTLTDRFGNVSDRAMFAIEYETTQWSKYRFYGQPDKLIDNSQLRIGGQVMPNPNSLTSYWNRVTYRAGVRFGKDYINADGKELSEFGITAGLALPVRKFRSFDNQFTVINTSLEVGKRGNKDNNVTESYFRLAFGVSLSDIWFIKRKYD